MIIWHASTHNIWKYKIIHWTYYSLTGPCTFTGFSYYNIIQNPLNNDFALIEAPYILCCFCTQCLNLLVWTPSVTKGKTPYSLVIQAILNTTVLYYNNITTQLFSFETHYRNMFRKTEQTKSIDITYFPSMSY